MIGHGVGKNEMSDQKALCEAVENGYADMVELLINDKNDFNHKDAASCSFGKPLICCLYFAK